MRKLRDDTYGRPESLVKATETDHPSSPSGVLYSRSLLRSRMVVGVLGILLPIALIIGEAFFLREGVHVRGSISAYYHTSMRDLFVAGLCVTGFFLATYMAGHRNEDFWWSLVAGVALFGVVFFPTQRPRLLEGTPRCGTEPMPDGCSPVQQWLGEGLVAGVHFACAAIFIFTLARICYLFAKREHDLKGTRPRVEPMSPRTWVLYACTGVILLAVVVAIVGATIWKFTIWELTPLYLAEVASVWAFGLAWLLKSTDLLPAIGHRVEVPPAMGSQQEAARQRQAGNIR